MSEVSIVKKSDDVVMIGFNGRIDSLNVTESRKKLAKLRAENPKGKIQLDFKNLKYISSAGLRLLLALHKKEKSQGKIKIVNVNDTVYDIFERTGFVALFNLQRALKSVSVEGCELIGSGANGEVFKYDMDTVIKVYHPSAPIEDVQRERNLAQRALLNGIPTAIPYNVVRVDGEKLGILFELLGAECLSAEIKAYPEKFDKLATQYVNLYKKLHTTQGSETEFPQAKAIYHGYIDGCDDWYSKEEIMKLRKLVDSIPDRNTLLHGDFHPRNIMYIDGELRLIDMGDVSIGHPIFDFLATASTQANLLELNPDFAEVHTGMPVAYIKKLWDTLLNRYFSDKSVEEIQAIDKQIRIFSKLKVACAPVVGRGIPMALIEGSVNDAKQNLIPLIDDLVGMINW